MNHEIKIYNFNKLLSYKDSLIYTRKITSRLAEKNILIGTDIFSIKYSLSKGDVIGIFYNGKIIRPRWKNVDEVLSIYNISLDKDAKAEDYHEVIGYVNNASEEINIKELSNLPNSSMLKIVKTKKNNYLLGVAFANNYEIIYTLDSRTKNILELEINGKREEVTKENIKRINDSLEVKPKVKDKVKEETGVKEDNIYVKDIPYFGRNTIYRADGSGIIRGYAVLGVNIFRFDVEDTKEYHITKLTVNGENIELNKESINRLNKAVEVIEKAIKEKKGIFTLNEIENLEDISMIRRIDKKRSEGFAILEDKSSIRFIMDTDTKIIRELEMNGRIIPVSKRTIIYLSNLINSRETKDNIEENLKRM